MPNLSELAALKRSMAARELSNSAIYGKMLDVVDRRLDQGLSINNLALIWNLGVSRKRLLEVFDEYPQARVLVNRCKRTLGCCADDKLHL